MRAVIQRVSWARVEVGGEVAAHTIGADHHESADRIARRLAQFRIAVAAVLVDVLEFCAEHGVSSLRVAGWNAAEVYQESIAYIGKD